ncbi:tetratricopeptide repeat protein [Bacteroides heparinolyticus]|uniref:Tetratricopeptide repeat protein n=1 Tax=Prevotella heparinolytica TaxID=28113 RepID=A0A449I2F2_9BACE|nr:tetratricopeptide repeat protein [Bacteroides heparinolyticus]VFB13568.1 tetratricopeptide repeat protein [Bacteroides heparinolyticus]
MKRIFNILHYCNLASFLVVISVTLMVIWADNKNKVACNIKDENKAISICQQAININSSNPLYHANLGILYARQKDINNAIKHFQKACIQNPQDANFYFNMGLLYQMQRKVDKALMFLEKAKNIEPYNPMFLIFLGLLHENKGNIKEAKKMYVEAISHNPSILDSRFYSDLKLRNKLCSIIILKEAQEKLEQTTLHENPILLANLGKILQVRENLRKADSVLKKALLSLPNLNRPYLYLGQIASLRNDSLEAKKYYDKAVLLDPYDVSAIWHQAKMEKQDYKKRRLYDFVLHLLKYRTSSRYDRNIGIYKTASLGKTEICANIGKYIQPQIGEEEILRFMKENGVSEKPAIE